MLKKFDFLFLIICISIGLSGCMAPDAMILFNKYPITKDNLLDNATEFPAGKRFYYIVITQTPLTSDLIRVRVLKRDAKVYHDFINLVYSNDFKLRKDQVYYYNDYLIINQPGEYFMEVYDRYAMSKPIATADFKITD